VLTVNYGLGEGIMRISVREIEMLRALAAGEAGFVTSSHRLRLEMLGLVLDGPNGLRLTGAGREASMATIPPEPQDLGNSAVTFNAGESQHMWWRRCL
jgi:hypothetical protein